MSKGIFLSIKPEYTQLIEVGEKPYELRNFNPKHDISEFYIYESAPLSQVSYIAVVGKPICHPNQIDDYGIESERFNKGISKYKKAYPIQRLYKLKSPIKLETLKSNYGFNAPQGFIYADSYPQLLNEIKNAEKTLIF